ncbi:MAG: C25 family cysteine peptidase [Ardenticatenaceae bacterium]|nr:C25 family cysteine peptidase [Ardenticatenaceae bacterium]
MVSTRVLLPALLALAVSACWRGPAPHPQPPGEPIARARIVVSAPGAYHLDAATLTRLGARATSPLALSLHGVPVPLVRRGNGLVFFVPPSFSRDAPGERLYTTDQTLWLTSSQGGAPEAGDGAPRSTGGTRARGRLRLEENHIYNPKADGDPWFWRSLPAPATTDFSLDLPGRQPGPVTVEVILWGATLGAHRAALELAGQQSAEVDWAGNRPVTLTATVEAPGTGPLPLALVQPAPAAGVDVILLDAITATYPRTLDARDDRLDLIAEGNGPLVVSGLSGEPVVWRLGEPLRPVAVRWERGRATFAAQAGASYVVRGPRAWAAATATPAPDAMALRTTPTGADYLAIVAPGLQQAVQPLLEAHTTAGLTVAAVSPQAIYDAFGDGNEDPEAIRAFLRHTQSAWQPAPRFVLLVGDATYDPAGWLGDHPLPADVRLPSPFIPTVFGGWTVSDNHLADLDGDGAPDLALGRLPADSPAQLAAYVRKVEAYTTAAAGGAWRRQVLLTADGQNREFKTASEALKQTLPQTVRAVTFYPPAGQDVTLALRPLLDDGALLVNYVGHGSVEQLGKDKFLTTAMAGQLANGPRLPVVITMTCLTGLFSHPSQTSVAEALLWNPQGGAVAVFAPTSLTLPTSQNQLNQALVQALLDQHLSLGEAVLQAKRSLPLNTADSHDVVATFNLLGDPALTLAPLN